MDEACLTAVREALLYICMMPYVSLGSVCPDYGSLCAYVFLRMCVLEVKSLCLSSIYAHALTHTAGSSLADVLLYRY